MRRISAKFNPNNKHSVKNLHQVLSYLLDEDVYQREHHLRRFGPKSQEAVKKVLGKVDVPRNGELSVETIEQINVALLAKKYSEPGHIAELHRHFHILSKKKFIKMEVAEEEIKNQVFGSSTRTFVKTFQKKYKLPETGEMNPDTEEKLDSVIASIAGSKPQPKKQLKVKNPIQLRRVMRGLRINKQGEKVQNLQKGLVWLGYKINHEEFKTQTFGKTTKIAVRQYQQERGYPMTGRVDNATAKAMTNELAIANPRIKVCGRNRVRGSVRDEAWEGVGGLTVRVYQKGIRGVGTLLGSRKTFNSGFFDVLYEPPDVAPLHLIVKVVEGEGAAEKELYSKTYHNVKRILWANFTAGEDRYLGTSEYDTMIYILGTAGAGEEQKIKLEEIEQSNNREDVTFLYRQTNILPETIMKLSLAHRIHQKIKQDDGIEISAAIFYAFLRQNLPPDLPSDLFPDEPDEWDEWLPRVVDNLVDGIVFLDKDVQQSALENAFAHNYIPRKLKVTGIG